MASVFLVFTAAPAGAALTEAARLAAIYDTILRARFDRVDAQIADACPPAPVEACNALAAVSVWWQILLDPGSRRLDQRFGELTATATAASEAWTKREPEKAEAWFYLAGSYAPLVQWRVLRGERVAAARGGNRIREALERALRLDPSLQDAYFGIGLYHYYADVVPGTVKFVRWLMFLPGGDRVKGLREMLQARDRGELLTGEADYQLHLLYLWYEHRTEDALALVEGLDERYSSNPLFLIRIAEIQDVYMHDHPASAAAWEELLARTRRGHVNAARLAEARARLGLARELDAMFETDRAVDELTAVVKLAPASPAGARAQAELQLGAAYDRLGQRDLAVRAYSAAVTLGSGDEGSSIREKARAELERVMAAPAAPAIVRASAYVDYAAALERAGDRDRALALYRDAAQMIGGDPRARDRARRAIARLNPRVRAETFSDFCGTSCLTSPFSHP